MTTQSIVSGQRYRELRENDNRLITAIRMKRRGAAIHCDFTATNVGWVTEGFSHFVSSMTAPVASGWSGCRVGLAPTGKRRLSTAHTRHRH
jgi:hypothetical protein